jgi:hypothetical protein
MFHVAKHHATWSAKVPLNPTRRALDRRGVGRRYGGKHPRTIKRWKDRGVIPPPDFIIGDRDYWYEDTLDEADRQRTIEAAAKNKPAKPGPVIKNEEQEPQTAP